MNNKPNGTPGLIAEKVSWSSNRRERHERPILGVVLAAGMSRRFPDRAKLDVEYRGRALLRRACDAARNSSLDAVVVILGADAAVLQRHCDAARVPTLLNPRFAEGQSTSVHLGIAAAPEGAVATLFLAADQPLIEATDIDRILVASRASDKVVRAVARSAIHGPRVVGTPVVFPRRLFSNLRELRGDQGGRQVLDTLCSSDILEVPLAPEVLLDIDSPEDLARLQSLQT